VWRTRRYVTNDAVPYAESHVSYPHGLSPVVQTVNGKRLVVPSVLCPAQDLSVVRLGFGHTVFDDVHKHVPKNVSRIRFGASTSRQHRLRRRRRPVGDAGWFHATQRLSRVKEQCPKALAIRYVSVNVSSRPVMNKMLTGYPHCRDRRGGTIRPSGVPRIRDAGMDTENGGRRSGGAKSPASTSRAFHRSRNVRLSTRRAQGAEGDRAHETTKPYVRNHSSANQ